MSRATLTCRWWMCRRRAARDGKLVLSIVNTNPDHAVQVVTNLTGSAHGRILTAFAMDAHNTFDAPNMVHPLAFQSSTEGGKMSFDMPAKGGGGCDGGLSYFALNL